MHGLNFYLLPQNYTSHIPGTLVFNYVAPISKAQGQCGLPASLQPSMNLATHIKFLIFKVNPMSGECQRAILMN